MEIKVELKTIPEKVFDDLEEEMKNTIKLLNEEQRTNLKHAIMDIKINIDNLERRVKNITQELKDLKQPKQEVVKKQVIKDSNNIEEIDL